MKITTTSKNYVASDKLIRILGRKLEALDRYFDDNAICAIAFKRLGKTDKMEVTLNQKGKIFRAEATSNNMFANIDLALAKLEKQILKNKEKLKDILKKGSHENKKYVFYAKEPKFVEAEVIRQKSFDVEPMDPREAELAMDTIDHSFYIYANKKNGRINVMYKRADGNLGIIEITNSRT